MAIELVSVSVKEGMRSERGSDFSRDVASIKDFTMRREPRRDSPPCPFDLTCLA